MDLPAQIAGFLVAVGCTALVIVRAATAPSPPPLNAVTEADRARFAATIASQEHDWRRKAATDFPHDNWSQRDAFHGYEALTVIDMAGAARVPYEEVLRAIDDDLHGASSPDGGVARRPDRNVNAVPVKPRPIFD